MTRKILAAAFAAMSLCISGCRDSDASREGQPVPFTREDAAEMLSAVMHSIVSYQARFACADGRRMVIAVDALDVSSPACDESAASAVREFDMRLRKELANSGSFIVYDAANRGFANAGVLPRCRFKAKLVASPADDGGVCLTLNAAIVDIPANAVMWRKKVVVRKRVR